MSHTVGPESFTPAILAFGAQPRLPIGNYEQQPQTITNRMDLMQIARREYESIVAKLRIRRALHSATPNETALDLTPGAEVLVYREKDGWQGPYTFLYRDGRLSVVLDDKGYEHLFHNTMIKPYSPPNLGIKDIIYPTDPDEADTDISVHYTQMVKDENDPRFKEQTQKEYDGIKAKGGVIPFNRADLPTDANIVGNRYILGIKDPDTAFERLKARWILQGHTDALRHDIANNSPMLMRMTYRIIISFAVIFFALLLWLRDVE